MQPGLDPFSAPSSFTARRSAASNLPNFELPPPPLGSLHGKYQPFSATNNTSSQPQSGSVASVGNLLTPPNTVNGEVTPAGAASNSTAQQTATSNYTSSSSSYWGPASQQPAQYSYQSGSNGQWIPPRGLFSPSSAHPLARPGSSNSPIAADGNSQQQGHSYENNNQLPPFSSSSAPLSPPPATSSSGPHASMYNNLSHSSSQNSHTSPIGAQDAFGIRPPPTPTYFNQSSSSSGNFSYPMPSPANATPGHHQRLSGTSPGEMPSLQQTTSHSPHSFSRPYSSYSLPTLPGPGPILSNLHGPSGSMAMGAQNGIMGSFGGSNSQHIYGINGQSVQAQTPNDRPFKCDQCVQSFNRNHDLKRHKRIHLAVKPYPCNHCDKSFSRKDALKVCCRLPDLLWT